MPSILSLCRTQSAVPCKTAARNFDTMECATYVSVSASYCLCSGAHTPNRRVVRCAGCIGRAANDMSLVFKKAARELSSAFTVWALRLTERCVHILLQDVLVHFAAPLGLDHHDGVHLADARLLLVLGRDAPNMPATAHAARAVAAHRVGDRGARHAVRRGVCRALRCVLLLTQTTIPGSVCELCAQCHLR